MRTTTLLIHRKAVPSRCAGVRKKTRLFALVTGLWLVLGMGLVWAESDDLQNIPESTPGQEPGLNLPGANQPDLNPEEPPANAPLQPAPPLAIPQPAQPSIQQSPSQSQTVIVPLPATPSTAPAGTATPDGSTVIVPNAPQQTIVVPQPESKTVVPVPETAPKVVPITPEVVPVTPEKTTPSIKAPETVVIPKEPEKKSDTKPEPPKTQADFLLKTPEPKKEEPKKEPKKTAPMPQKAEPPKKPADEPKKEEPKKEEPKKEEPAPKSQPPAKGQPLKVPDDAKKTGNLSFLQGCWKGTRPEYYTKRTVIERFCFDEKGNGKRTVIDPTYGRQCTGAARAVINQGGVLRIQSEQAHCNSGDTWGVAEMMCEGEGESTPCSWRFDDVGRNARQSYKITFVRD